MLQSIHAHQYRPNFEYQYAETEYAEVVQTKLYRVNIAKICRVMPVLVQDHAFAAQAFAVAVRQNCLQAYWLRHAPQDSQKIHWHKPIHFLKTTDLSVCDHQNVELLWAD